MHPFRWIRAFLPVKPHTLPWKVGGKKEDQGASSSKLPVETQASAELKPSEVLEQFLHKYQSRPSRVFPLRTTARPEMKTDAQHYTLATPPVTPPTPES